MFDRISGIYDLINRTMTAGLDRDWRRRAAELADVREGDRVIDVATGTGDLAIELARRAGSTGEVVGCDFSEAMLTHARAKAPHVHFEYADALALPYADDSFDAATSAFAVRNFSDLKAGLSELARVVRPGGRVVVLEFTTPQRRPLSTFYRVWFDQIVPLLGRVAGDADAYAYLPASVARFPAPAELAALLAQVDLQEIRYILTAGGMVAFHIGVVASERPGPA
jgi:demethylmenaquinone methyltransferase/2-methoxy-6-polyprenyl-1,4-benzoquinol methylase